MDLYSGLLIVYFIFFTLLAVKNLKWAIYVIIFALPSYLIRFELGWLPVTVLEIMIWLLFLAWAIKIFKQISVKALKDYIIRYNILFILIGLFLLSATVAMFVSPNLRAAAGIWKAYFIEPILFLVVLVSTIKEEDFKIIFKVLLWQVLILSLIAIYQKISGNLIPNKFWAAQATRRVTGVFGYPNALALYLAPIVVMLSGYLFQLFKFLANSNLKSRLLKFGSGILFIILALSAVYFTKSKGAALGILAGMFFYIVFDRALRKYFIVILLFLVLLGGYGLLAGKIDLKGRATVAGGDSVSVRLEIWQESWQMLKARPVWGAGLAGYQTIIKPYHQKKYIEIYLYPHNIFLNFWSELGLLGLLSFLALIGWFYWQGFKSRNKTAIILMAGMATLIIHGLVDVPYFKNDLSVFFWLLMGMMIVLSHGIIGGNRRIEV